MSRPACVECRICEEIVPVSQRGLLKRHASDDLDFYCDGSLKPWTWGKEVSVGYD